MPYSSSMAVDTIIILMNKETKAKGTTEYIANKWQSWD